MLLIFGLLSPITTAAEEKSATSFSNFRKKVMIFHEKLLQAGDSHEIPCFACPLADDSHVIPCLICYL